MIQPFLDFIRPILRVSRASVTPSKTVFISQVGHGGTPRTAQAAIPPYSKSKPRSQNHHTKPRVPRPRQLDFSVVLRSHFDVSRILETWKCPPTGAQCPNPITAHAHAARTRFTSTITGFVFLSLILCPSHFRF